jgi:D-alanine transfer protein
MNRQMPHLLPAFGAVLLAVGFLAGFSLFAQNTEDHYVHDLVTRLAMEKNTGIALQNAAFRQPDLLVVYGSSEMRDPPNTRYRATEFFKSYPTGFTVMDIARPGITSLIIAQNLAADGADLNGKKVVVSFTPSMFEFSEVGLTDYMSNFSQLHADELVFDAPLSTQLKSAIAKRMLAYPVTLEHAPLLRFALHELAVDTPISLAMVRAIWPLGEMEIAALKLEDHASLLNYLWTRKYIPRPVRQPAAIDWAKEVENAQTDQLAHTPSNSFGMDFSRWRAYEHLFNLKVRPGSQDKEFLDKLQQSTEWTDFELMLQVLRELGAKPLLLSRPYNGTLFNVMGVSTNALNTYYDKLETTVAPYQYPLLDFRQFTGDPYFSADKYSHTNLEGWVYVDQALDAFYHGELH